MRARVGALTLALLLLPLAAAHVDHERYSIQPEQRERQVRLDLEGTRALFGLSEKRDPLVHSLRHTVEPARGIFASEHRAHASQPESAFAATWRFDRLIEYKDSNQDGLYQPTLDTVVRSWPMREYDWNATARDVRVGSAIGKGVVWNGEQGGAPALRVEAVGTGRAFVDEGAAVREQDLILYVDILGLPSRGVGNLYALDGALVAPRDAKVRPDVAGNLTTAILVEHGDRLAFLDWGAQALTDGREETVIATWGDPDEDGERLLIMHLPLADREFRLVMVAGIEYAPPDARAPGVGLVGVVVGGALAVGLAGGVRRRGLS